MVTIDKSDIALVDLQFCNGNDKTLYVKELAYMLGVSVIPTHHIFKPPFSIRRLTKQAIKQNIYNKTYIHNLDWTDGEVDYNRVDDILQPLAEHKYIFVFGKNKKEFLLQHLNLNVINLENKISFKKLKNYITSCPVHDGNYMNFKCSLNNIFKLFIFLEKNDNNLEKLI